jgi:glutamate---cysteine ligase / carboxylate-amine ligase
MVEYPTELIDDNKVRAAIHGIEGRLMDFREGKQEPARAVVSRMRDELVEHAQELGCEDELGGVEDLIANGTGARRQLRMFESNGDVRELVRETADHTRP